MAGPGDECLHLQGQIGFQGERVAELGKHAPQVTGHVKVIRVLGGGIVGGSEPALQQRCGGRKYKKRPTYAECQHRQQLITADRQITISSFMCNKNITYERLSVNVVADAGKRRASCRAPEQQITCFPLNTG